MASFTRLYRQENPTAEQVVLTMRNYVEEGKQINPDVVLFLMDKTRCTRDQLKQCLEMARLAVEQHVQHQDHEATRTYSNFVNQLESRLPKETDVPPGSGDASGH